MNRCKKYRKLLNLFLTGDLDESKAREVRLHLAGCPCCRKHARELEQSQAALQSLREWVSPCASDSLWPELAPRIARLGRERSDWTGWLPVGALAAACLAVYVWGTASWTSFHLRPGRGPAVTARVVTGEAFSRRTRVIAPTDEWIRIAPADARPVLPDGRAMTFERKQF